VKEQLTDRPSHACVLHLAAGADGRRSLLGGRGLADGMRAGVVSLEPGRSVGRHNTRTREELIVVLEGKGDLLVQGGDTVPLEAGSGAYVPPEQEHDVVNTGAGPLRYVYVVAPVAGAESRK
jgi:oxalate decarboxylase/phosphoglucose isomerase-like protein (cupin superfamily)